MIYCLAVRIEVVGGVEMGALMTTHGDISHAEPVFVMGDVWRRLVNGIAGKAFGSVGEWMGEVDQHGSTKLPVPRLAVKPKQSNQQ